MPGSTGWQQLLGSPIARGLHTPDSHFGIRGSGVRLCPLRTAGLGARQPGLLVLSPCPEPLRGCWTVPPSLQENQSSTWPQGKPWHARDREAGEAQATPAKMLTLLTKPQSP